jgi:uncharacterized membrane protein
MTKNHWMILLTVVALLATSFLRFHDLGHMQLSHDEVYSISRVFGIRHQELVDAVHDGKVHTPAELLRFQNAQPGNGLKETLGALEEHPEHSPLYYLIGWAVSDWSDKPISALRGASAVLSLLLFPAIFWLTRELWDRRYAWTALALTAASPLFFLYAREARQYAFWLALISGASAALVRFLRHSTPGNALIYIVLLSLAMYTHLMTGLVMLAHALFVVLHLRQQRAELVRVGKWLVVAWGVALVLFAPWFAVILERRHAFANYTDWMSHATSISHMFTAWTGHLSRLFVDIPGTEPMWILGMVAASIVTIRFFLKAPHQPRLFLGMLMLTYVCSVVLPDLLLGGRRSIETRYLLPLLLALELIVAWAITSSLSSIRSNLQRTSFAAFILLLASGLYSQYVISSAETWWTKSFSMEDATLAKVINASKKPLVIGSYSTVSTGEILLLTHMLDAHVHVLMENWQQPAQVPDGYSQLFVFMPSDELKAQLERRFKLEPFQGSWKWYVASALN